MKGEVLYLNDNEDSDQKHPCFIISDPNEDNNVLIVNATTFHDTGREDNSCIIYDSECDIIKHTSYIDFAKAREVNCEWLLKKKIQ